MVKEEKLPVEVDGDLIVIDWKKMETSKVYFFIYKGEKHGVWINEEGKVTMFIATE